MSLSSLANLENLSVLSNFSRPGNVGANQSGTVDETSFRQQIKDDNGLAIANGLASKLRGLDSEFHDLTAGKAGARIGLAAGEQATSLIVEVKVTISQALEPGQSTEEHAALNGTFRNFLESLRNSLIDADFEGGNALLDRIVGAAEGDEAQPKRLEDAFNELLGEHIADPEAAQSAYDAVAEFEAMLGRVVEALAEDLAAIEERIAALSAQRETVESGLLGGQEDDFVPTEAAAAAAENLRMLAQQPFGLSNQYPQVIGALLDGFR